MKLIHIHDAPKAFPGVSFPGIEFYPDRALVERGVVVVPGPQESLRHYLPYLKRLGLGPSEVLFTQGDLYDALLEDDELRQAVRRLVLEEGYRVRFFNTSGGVEESLLQDTLRLPIETLASPPSTVADWGNNKAHLRRGARRYGLGDLFPRHEIASGIEELSSACAEMIEWHDHIGLKQPMLATGIGMLFGSVGILSKFLKETPRKSDLQDIIVEEALFPHISMTIVYMLEAGQVVDRWVTQQNCHRDISGEHVIHENSVLGDLPYVDRRDEGWLFDNGQKLLEMVLSRCPQLTGVVNFDALRHTPTGRRVFTEANVRQTLSACIRAIQQGLSVGSSPAPTCLMERVETRPGIGDFRDVGEGLGELLLINPQGEGILPVLPRCVTRGYFYPVAVASSFKRARALMDQTREKLA